ncbi:MAG: aminotransferase class I/II-fold pyridoxal phosphate-dependent enzyme, partial [Armatimonadetes bacterium]|nr:aminotransferase class I/II-fold pyridoxal phosphate-dependent enzyme [Armatimonadota bacterium]
MPDHCIDTQLVWLGSRPDPEHGSVTTPIFQTSTFSQSSPGEYGLYDYTRTDNPTRTVLQQMLAVSEGAKYGLAFSSGMAAIDCIFGILEAGDHILTSDDLYGGTYRYLEDVVKFRGVEFDFVNIADEEVLRASIKPNTKLIWIESPTNPLLNLVDVAMVVRVAKEKGIRTAMDNTFMSPYFQKPLSLGVDFVMHSMTKYINGHSDVIMGALMTNDDKAYERLKYLQNAIGPTPSPFDCFLAIRGMKTLGVRMR